MEEKMWEYEGIGGKIEEGKDSGEFEDYKGAEWSVEAREVEDTPLNEATVEVTLKEGDRRRRFEIVTYFYSKE